MTTKSTTASLYEGLKASRNALLTNEILTTQSGIAPFCPPSRVSARCDWPHLLIAIALPPSCFPNSLPISPLRTERCLVSTEHLDVSRARKLTGLLQPQLRMCLTRRLAIFLSTMQQRPTISKRIVISKKATPMMTRTMKSESRIHANHHCF